MSDEPMLRAFGLLDAPVEPDPAFADRLFETLAADLGFRPDRRARGSAGARLLRLLGIERLPVGAPALRLAYIAAILGLLLAMVIGTLLVAGLLRSRPSPPELVRLSQEVYAKAPAVRWTMNLDAIGIPGTAVIQSDGRGTWRSETPDAPAGSFMLYDGKRVGVFDSTTRTWTINAVENGGPPYPLNDAFTWTTIEFPALKATLGKVDCSGATDLGETTIAGRTADGVWCAAVGTQYWIDRETHLVLRTVAVASSPRWSGQIEKDMVTEVAEFQELDAPPAADFAWTGPSESYPLDAPLASTVLKIGERPLAWTGQTIDGQAIATDGLATPAAVLFIRPSCPSCTAAYEDFAAVAPGLSELTSMIVVADESGSGAGFAAGFRQQHPTELPIVNDTGALFHAWGITGEPALVLLGSDGTVRGMSRARVSRDDLALMLAAAAGDQPIPSIVPVPSPTPTPGDPSLDPSVVCGEDLLTCLPVGSRMPEWTGSLMQGGALGSAELAGKPSVIWFAGARCDGPCPDWFLGELRDFASLAERYRGRANLIILSDGENRPGDTRKALDDAGVDIPVVFDWDGAITPRFQLVVMGALVYDAEGRLAGHATSPGIASVAAILDGLVTGQPSSSPSSSAP